MSHDSSARPSPTAALRVCDELPCPPQELVFRRYAPYFELGATSPFLLTASVLPSMRTNNCAVIGTSSVENIAEAVQKLETMALPTVPTDNIRQDIRKRFYQQSSAHKSVFQDQGMTSLFSFPHCVETTISSSCVLTGDARHSNADTAVSGGGAALGHGTKRDATVITGLTTGAILVWSLRAYHAHICALRQAALEATPSSARGRASAADSRSWGTATVPSGIALLGCHALGTVTSVVGCDGLGLVVSGGADGSVYLWDASGAYLPGHLVAATDSGAGTTASGSAAGSVLDTFAATVRLRNSLQVHSKVHAGAVTALAALSKTFVSGGADGVVCVWYVQTHDAAPVDLCGPRRRLPQCHVTQRFHMSGWVRSVEAFHMQAVLDAEFIVSSDSGVVMRLQASHEPATSPAPAQPIPLEASTGPSARRRSARTARTAEPVSSDSGACVFKEKWRRPVRSEETRRLGLATSDGTTDSSNTVVRTLTIGADRLIVAVGFSPVVQVLDTHSLHPVLRITHPSLTAEGSALHGAPSPAQSSDRDGAARIAASPPPPSSRSGAPAASHAAPLRFVDLLYVPQCDSLVLLDSRNTIFLYDRSLGRFTAFAQVPTTGEGSKNGVQCARKLLPWSSARAPALLPSAQTDTASSEAPPSHAGTTFLVACDKAIYACWICPSETAIANTTAHSDAVVGVCSLAATAAMSGRQTQLESLSGERIALVSVSRSATLCCLDARLRLKRSYVGPALNAPVVCGGGSGDRSVQVSTMGEVTAFHYSLRFGYAVTGHEQGGLCLWGCADELADVVACLSAHANSVSGIAEVCLDSQRTRLDASRFITVGFDGFVASWKQVEKRRPLVAKRHRLSWSELVSVVTIASEAMDTVAVADQAGAFFVLETRELTPLFVCADGQLTVVPSPRWQPTLSSVIHKASVPYGHTSGVVGLCVSASAVVLSADESGVCLVWRTDSPLQPPSAVRWPSGFDRADINCVCAVTSERFVVAVRGGPLFLLHADVGAAEVTGVHDGAHDITTITPTYKPNDTFCLVLGSADGQIAIVEESMFSSCR